MYTYTVETKTAKDKAVFDQKITKHSSEHVNTSTGNYLDPKLVAKGYPNKITVENIVTGEIKVYDTRVVDGVSYTLDGKRVVPGGNSKQVGLVPGGKEAITHLSRVIGEDSTYIRYSPIEEVPIYKDVYKKVKVGEKKIYPEAPALPVYETFDVPEPTFTAELKRESRFIYFMGTDKIDIRNTVVKKNGLHYTELISTEGCDKLELLTEAFTTDNCSIEYAIVDGDVITPILPNGETIVENELLFPNMPTRFAMSGTPIEIKKNGEVINMSLADAKNRRDGSYSVTYRTTGANEYVPVNDAVRIAVTIRIYTEEEDIPNITSIKLKLHGGGSSLWQEA